MYRVHMFKDYGAGTFTINSIYRGKKVIDSQEANFLAIKLINIFQV